MWFKFTCCIIAIFAGTLHVTNSAYLRCFRGALNDYVEVPLELAETVLNTSCYNSRRNNSFYTFGYQGKVYGNATTAVLEALLKLDRNVFLLNWEEEASSVEFLGDMGIEISYVIFALPNTIRIGNSFGQALIKMSEFGLDLTRTYLLAHSLGAQVFGYTGRYIRSVGKIIDRITGLDPAGPFFDNPHILTPLGKECARFVDTIHTDPGGYALNSSHAKVDIYVNFKYFINGTKAEQVQPGCPVGDYAMFSEKELCSHNRVWMLIIESWTNGHNLQASAASTYYEWEDGVLDNRSPQVIYMGDDMDRAASGNFYMSTNAQSPYGRGANGLRP